MFENIRMKLNKFDFVPNTRNNVTDTLRIANDNEKKEMAEGIWREKNGRPKRVSKGEFEKNNSRCSSTIYAL